MTRGYGLLPLSERTTGPRIRPVSMPVGQGRRDERDRDRRRVGWGLRARSLRASLQCCYMESRSPWVGWRRRYCHAKTRRTFVHQQHQHQPAGNDESQMKLAHQVATLQRRMNRQRRALIMLLSGLFAVLVFAMGAGTQEEANRDRVKDIMQAKAFQVVDEKGRAVVEITAGEMGGKIVLRSAASGKDIVRIEADAAGGAVRTFQNDGQRATELFTYQMTAANTVGGLNIFDFKGNATVSLGTGFHGGGPVSMGAHCPGGVLVLSHDGDDDRGGSQMMRVDLCLLRELAEIVGRD